MTNLARIAGFLLAWVLILLALAAAVCAIAGNGDLLARKMLEHAPPEVTGLPETEYPGVGRMTAAYLTGREETFQYTFPDAEGRVYQCFRSHEAAHMADCRELIALAAALRRILGGAALVLAGTGVLFRERRRAFAGGMLAGLGTTGAVAMLLLVWALIDFDGLFMAFHRLAFTNDGWILDPRTDLLIRLMPTDFFTEMGLWLLAAAAAAWLAAFIAAEAARKRQGKKGEQ